MTKSCDFNVYAYGLLARRGLFYAPVDVMPWMSLIRGEDLANFLGAVVDICHDLDGDLQPWSKLVGTLIQNHQKCEYFML